MLVASISQAKNKLSALLDRVKAGEAVVIVDRGVPVARLVPAVSADEDADGRLARLERNGLVQRGGSLKKRGPAKLPRARASAVEVLLAERRGGR